MRGLFLNNGEFLPFIADPRRAHPPPGPYLEIKSRTWSRKDADAKAALIGGLLGLLGVAEHALVKQEYVEL